MVIRSENPSLARRTQPSSPRALAVAGAPGPSLAASVRSSAGPTRFYDSDAVPMVSASLTGRTDQGVFIGASAGSLAAIARLSGGDEGFASGSVLVRPGFVSHGRLLPSASTPEPLSDSL